MMYHQYKEGYVEVITGCMFAGKTEELIRRINTLKYANKEILVFRIKMDKRYSETAIVSHSGTKIDAISIDKAHEILEYVTEATDVVSVDEIHFFDDEIVKVCDYLAKRGIRVMVAGLDMDFRGEPFGVIPTLMTTAEFVTKLTAVCTVCGAPATRSQRLVNGLPAKYDDPIVMVGASEDYEARCRHDHIVVGKPQIKE